MYAFSLSNCFVSGFVAKCYEMERSDHGHVSLNHHHLSHYIRFLACQVCQKLLRQGSRITTLTSEVSGGITGFSLEATRQPRVYNTHGFSMSSSLNSFSSLLSTLLAK